MAKKTPKLHQYNLFKKSGSATIDLEARGIGRKRLPGVTNKSLPKYPRNFGFTQHPTPSKSAKKAIWLEGYSDIRDKDAVRKTLDKIWSDTMGTYKPEDVEIWYGGYEKSDTDFEIKQWTEAKGIQSRIISPFDEIFNQSGTPKDKIARRGAALKKLEAQGAKGGTEGRQLLNMYNINDVGEIKYNYADTSKWWDRYSELQTQYGKGNTRKVVTAYLDEVEDVKHGSTLKNPNITSSLAALEVLEDKNTYYRKDAKEYNQMLIDEGHYDSSGTPEAIAFNKKQSTQELVKGTGYLKKPKVIKDLYSRASKNRIANIRGDVSQPLKTFDSIRTDFADSPGIEEGKEHVEDTGSFVRQQPYNTQKNEYVDKGKGEFKSQKVIMGKGKDGKNIIETFDSKRIAKNRINKSSLSVPKGQKIVDFSRPEVSKSAPIIDIVSELINKQVEDLGYSGKNVFGDHFLSEAEKADKAQLYEGKEGTRGTHTEKFNPEEVHSDQAKHLEANQKIIRKENTDLDKIIKKDKAIKSLGNFFSGEKREWRGKTMINQLKKVTDVDAPDQITTLGASLTTDEAKKKLTTSKVIGQAKQWYRTQAQIKKALPSEMKVINEEINKGLTKNPKERTVATTIKRPRQSPRDPANPSRPYTDHSAGFGKKRYIRMRTDADIVKEIKDTGKVVTDERGKLSRAYVSEPSRATTSDIRKELQKSSAPNKRSLPKNIHEVIKSKQSKVSPVEQELKSLSKIKRNKARIREKQNITKTVQVREKKIKRLLKAPSEIPQGETIKMTKSKVSGKWGTPSEHRKSALKQLGKGAGRTLPTTLGAFSALSIFTGAIRGKREARADLGREPNVMETLTHAFIPKAVRNADAKWKRKKGFTIEGMTN